MARRRPLPLVTASTSDPTELRPPSFQWLRCLAVVFLVAWLLVAGTWLVLYRIADRRLQRELAAARSRGEPVFIADFPITAITNPEDNAALHLLRAGVLHRPRRFTSEE